MSGVLAGLLGPPTGIGDAVGRPFMRWPGEVPNLAPPIHEFLNGEQGHAPDNEYPDCGDVSDHRREHGKPPLVAGWLVVEFAGRTSFMARMIACAVAILWNAR